MDNFDRHIGLVLNNDLDVYLQLRGFYSDNMSPRFLAGFGYDDLKHNKPCWRSDTIINENKLRIFINEVDIYYEVQSPYGSYVTSKRYDREDYPEVEDVAKIFSEIISDLE